MIEGILIIILFSFLANLSLILSNNAEIKELKKEIDKIKKGENKK